MPRPADRECCVGPGGNITGITRQHEEVTGNWIGIPLEINHCATAQLGTAVERIIRQGSQAIVVVSDGMDWQKATRGCLWAVLRRHLTSSH
jgi:hypothetical protein